MVSRILLAGALLLAASSSCQPAFAAPPPAESASIVDVLPICDKALDAALDGHDALAVVKDAVKAMPADEQRAVIGICGVYIAGAVAVLKRAAAAPPVPAGKQTSI